MVALLTCVVGATLVPLHFCEVIDLQQVCNLLRNFILKNVKYQHGYSKPIFSIQFDSN